jgi:hypothetical protein
MGMDDCVMCELIVFWFVGGRLKQMKVNTKTATDNESVKGIYQDC